jgi:DNA replication licensing factor MCM3
MSELSAHREDVVETPVFQKHNPLHRRKKEGEEKRQLYTMDFIKKFIIYAKNRFQPQLMDEAEDYIAEEYAKLRGKMDVRTQPVTARTLETLIRLSAAHAKCRLSHEVTKEDAEAAVALVNYALYHEAQPKSKPAKGQTAGQEDQSTTAATNGTNKRPAPTSDNNTARSTRQQQYDPRVSDRSPAPNPLLTRRALPVSQATSRIKWR